MEFSPFDLLWGYPWTLPYHLYPPPSCSLLPSPIFTSSWPQSLLVGLYFSVGSLLSPGGTFQLLSTPQQVLGVPFQ